MTYTTIFNLLSDEEILHEIDYYYDRGYMEYNTLEDYLQDLIIMLEYEHTLPFYEDEINTIIKC